MTDSQIKMILEKLDRQDIRLSSIEKAINTIAIQDEKILNISSNVNALWKKYDAAFSPEGVIAKIKDHQAGCPKDDVKYLKNKFFGMLIAIVLAYVSGGIGIFFLAFK